ncbi:LacI family DNA-binding transcriptional regulator [Luteococcus japonicus]|uniref:LacI family DNA-binding transcriptional regulator n=1 Tax=Luteococcus japonicus TaxID=33984 RepID=UPI00277B4B88|nr:LacI family DNA-binding transcriptional regulator [Luteococcus japonicus]
MAVGASRLTTVFAPWSCGLVMVASLSWSGAFVGCGTTVRSAVVAAPVLRRILRKPLGKGLNVAVITMTQVAQAAGVSLSTVSHVMNQTQHVAPATRAKVLEAAGPWAIGTYG